MRRLCLNSSLLALACAAMPAWAQEQTAADANEPADIVVTAQLRSERLQDVPVAITVLSGDALDTQGRVNLEGAVNLVPSFNFLKSGTTLNQSLFLRGVGTATFSIAGEPSVSTVVDGVVYARSGEAFQDLVDIDRLEVLRGPQGTLFGKNASAGVINITTKRPTDEFEGYVDAGWFSDDEWRGRVVLNTPLTDSFGVRTTGYYSNWDGNLTNVAKPRNRTVNGYEHYGFRVIGAGDLTDKIKLTAIADWHKNRDDCCAEAIGTGAFLAANGVAGAGAPTTNAILNVLPTPRGDRTRQISQDLVTRTNETGWGLSGQLDIEVGTHVITSITAYRKYENTEIRDGDFLPRAYVGFPQTHDVGPQDSSTYSQELRLTSPGGQFLDYVLGAYYSRAENRRVFTRNVLNCNGATLLPAPVACGVTGAPPTLTQSGTGDFGSVFETIALFGNVTLNFTDSFRAIGGLRYTDDKLDVFHRRTTVGLLRNAAGQPVNAPGVQPVFDQGVFDETARLLALGVPLTNPTNGGDPTTALNRGLLGSNGQFWRSSTDATNLSGRVGLQLDILDDSMVYGTYTRGYKGPAFNVFFNLNFVGTGALEPETSDAFEAGMKNTFLDGKLVLNVAAFYAKYKNFQANNPDEVAGVVVTRFTNAGTVSTRGAELDLIWRPVSDLSISGGVAYTDAQIDRFRLPPGGNPASVVPPGTRLPFAPEWKGSIAADYRFRTGGAVDLFLGAQSNFQSSQITQLSENANVRLRSTQDSYALVNLQAGVVSPDDRYRLTFQVRNLFDQSFAAAIQNGGPAGSYRYQIPRDADRYYGVTARVNF